MTNYSNNSKLKNRGKQVITTERKTAYVPNGNKTYIQTANKSKRYVIVETLISRVDNEKNVDSLTRKNTPAVIDNLIWSTDLNYTRSNLPKINDYEFHSLNFSFGKTQHEIKENYEDMVSSKKVVLAYYTHKIEKDNREYSVVRIYSIAPNLKNKLLPVIYRTDILTNSNNSNFYGIKCMAMVGGCIDGECKLFQIATNDKTSAKLFKIKSGHTNIDVDLKDDVSNIYYDVTEIPNIQNLADSVDYAFNMFGLTHSLDKGQFEDKKIWDIVEALNKKPRPDLVKINPSQYVKTIMENEVENNTGHENQTVKKEDGTMSNTLKSNQQKINEQKRKQNLGRPDF